MTWEPVSCHDRWVVYLDSIDGKDYFPFLSPEYQHRHGKPIAAGTLDACYSAVRLIWYDND